MLCKDGGLNEKPNLFWLRRIIAFLNNNFQSEYWYTENKSGLKKFSSRRS